MAKANGDETLVELVPERFRIDGMVVEGSVVTAVFADG